MSMVDQIRERLSEALKPVHLEVADESHMHNVPTGAESHFNVFVVSEAFEGKRAVARHQAVYRALAAEMAGSIHALALKTMAPAEWTEDGGGAVTSPQCLGGSKSDS
jgi:BolA protein